MNEQQSPQDENEENRPPLADEPVLDDGDAIDYDAALLSGLPDIDLEADVSASLGDPLDIDAALAAVSSLSDLLAQQDDDALFASQPDDAAIDDTHSEVDAQTPHPAQYAAHIGQPPIVTLNRGNIASLLPALFLMATGGYLTFMLTLSTSPIPNGMVALLVFALTGCALIAYWLHSGRWARGALFAGLLLLLSGGIFYLPNLALSLSSNAYWLAVIGAAGVATVITGILAKPQSGRFVSIGLAVLLACGVLLAVDMRLLSSSLSSIFSAAWVVVLPIAFCLMLLGWVFRRRSA